MSRSSPRPWRPPNLSAREELLSRTFDQWREEFRSILEDHRREIQDRLDQIERTVEKKSDKETMDVLVRSISSDLLRHSQEIEQLEARVSAKMGTDTVWKIVGLLLGIGSALGGCIGFLIHLLLEMHP